MRQTKWNHLLFYVLSFIQFCARKLLLLTLVLKLIFNYQVFSTKLQAHGCLGHETLERYFRVAPKRICRPLC